MLDKYALFDPTMAKKRMAYLSGFCGIYELALVRAFAIGLWSLTQTRTKARNNLLVNTVNLIIISILDRTRSIKILLYMTSLLGS